MSSLIEHKSNIRNEVWAELRKVARPDSRFHFNFAEFIADFEGSSIATELITNHEYYQNSEYIFITPDNCLEELRFKALNDGKKILMTTYGILRGFWLLELDKIPPGQKEMASTLDGMEKFGKPVSLKELQSQGIKVEYMITGTGAINYNGIRFGKGHGFFDLEWAMLYEIGVIDLQTHTAAIVHDCQLLDQELKPEIFDTCCDLIVTNSKIIEATNVNKPSCGVLWDLLTPQMFNDIPPLIELYNLLKKKTQK